MKLSVILILLLSASFATAQTTVEQIEGKWKRQTQTGMESISIDGLKWTENELDSEGQVLASISGDLVLADAGSTIIFSMVDDEGSEKVLYRLETITKDVLVLGIWSETDPFDLQNRYVPDIY